VRRPLPLSLLLGLLVLACALFTPLSWAQTPPRLRVSVSSNEVAVGEAFTLKLEATVGTGSPKVSDPQLSLPAGMTATNPSISNTSHFSVVNGQMSQSSGLSATYRIVADRAGTYTIPGPTVLWDGRRVSAEPVTITVHKGPPRAPQRAPSPAPNPFDPFGMLPGFPDPRQPPQEPLVPPELLVDVAPDPYVFFRAVADKTTAVVGEQVTLSIYLYSRTRVEWTDVHEPALADFLRRDLMQPGEMPEVHRLTIGGVTWRAQRVFHAAIFPLRAGDLDVGRESASILGIGRGTAARGGVLRQSQPLTVRVVEPPLAGRPTGYQLGDVGSYSMVASVQPRTVEQGGAVAVTVTLSGTGNVPPAVRMPMQTGIEWLEPEKRESFEISGTKVRGSRTFTYIARPTVAGTLDLGDVTLPYWDPERQSYETARASLGRLRVTPVAGADLDIAARTNDPFAALAGPRSQLASHAITTSPITDSRLFWLGILGAPIGVLFVSASASGLSRLRTRWEARKASTAQAFDQAIADAKAAVRAQDTRAAAAAIDRAVYLSIEAATGLKARALMLNELPGALEARGIDVALGERLRRILADAESIRFSPSDAASIETLLDEARAACRELTKAGKGATA